MGKRGPKRSKDVKREANGRRSRKREDEMDHFMKRMELAERNALDTGLRARNRVLGVSPGHTKDQKAGSAIGRYCLQGLVTQEQYDAAIRFLEDRDKNLIAIDAPHPPRAVNLNATHGRAISVENVEQMQKWREEYRAACAAIQEKQNEVRLNANLFGSLYAVLVDDVMLDTLLGDVRVALNALVKHYRLFARAA